LPDDSIISFEKAIDLGYIEEDLWEEYSELCLKLKMNVIAESAIERGLEHFPNNLLLQLYQVIIMYRNKKEDKAFDQLVNILIQDPTLIEEFLVHYPKGVEIEKIQFLIESLK